MTPAQNNETAGQESPPQTKAIVRAEFNIEELRYREELAAKVGLPSPYATKLIKEFCDELVHSGLVPSCFNGNPSAVYLAVMRGREMGLMPTESVLEVFYAAPGGRLGMYATKMLDLMHRGGVISKFIHEGADYCEILLTPPAPFEPYLSRFDFEEAEKAGLNKADSNWRKWPKAMNRSRATSIGWRALIGTFKGSCNIYSSDELNEMEEVIAQIPATAESPKLEVIAGKRLKAEREPPPPVTFDAKPEPAAEARDETVTKTGEKWLIRIGTLKTEPQSDFQVGSLRLVGASKDFPGVACYLDQQEFFSNGTSRITTVAERTQEKQPGPVAVPDTTDVATGPGPSAAPVDQAETTKAVDPAEAAKAEVKARAMAAYASLPVEARLQKQVGDTFLCGFFNVPVPKQWPKALDQRTAGVDALEKALRMHPDRFKGQPNEVKQFGADMAKDAVADDSASLYREMNWSPETAGIARRARTAFQHDAGDFSDWVGYFKLGQMPEADAAAFLTCAAASGRGTSNMKNMRELSERLNKPYSVIANSIALEYGKPMIELNEKQISEALSFIASIADRGNPAAQQESAATKELAKPPEEKILEDWD